MRALTARLAVSILLVCGTLAAAAPHGARSTARDAGGQASATALDARAIMTRADEALHYAGRDMRATVRMELGSAGKPTRYRTMTLLRWSSAPGGDQKYLLYFREPGDARRMACMVFKHVGTADERWMYVPVTGRVQRVQSPDRSSFLGSDFMREEFSGRDVDADSHRLVRREPIDGRDCYVIESVPRRQEEFSRSVSWIDAARFLPVRQEFWNHRGLLARVLTYGAVESFPTRRDPRATLPYARMWTARSMLASHWTTVRFDSVVYDIGLGEADFVQSRLMQQPADWLP